MKKTVALLFFLSLPGLVYADWTQDTMRWQHEQQQIQDRQQDRVNNFFFGGNSSRNTARQDSDQKRRDEAQDEEIRELRRQLEQQKAAAEQAERERQALDQLTDLIRAKQAKAGGTPATANFAGTWRGSYKSSTAGDRIMTMSLSQKGTSVSGKASTSGGGQLSIKGSVVGDEMAYIANLTVPGCVGAFVGYGGLVSADTLAFAYNGAASAACGGEENGGGTLAKE